MTLSPARLSHHLPASAGQAYRPRRGHRPPQHHLRRLISPPSRMAFHSGGLQPAILLLPDVCSGEFISPSFLSSLGHGLPRPSGRSAHHPRHLRYVHPGWFYGTERSRPTFSSAFAPANASACAVRTVSSPRVFSAEKTSSVAFLSTQPHLLFWKTNNDRQRSTAATER